MRNRPSRSFQEAILKGHLTILKPRINSAFRNLRKAGYFARQNFEDCQSCGFAAIPLDKAEKVVFYHQQDHAHLMESGYCYLSWNGDGHEIVRILKESGLDIVWDGSISTRILIKGAIM